MLFIDKVDEFGAVHFAIVELELNVVGHIKVFGFNLAYGDVGAFNPESSIARPIDEILERGEFDCACCLVDHRFAVAKYYDTTVGDIGLSANGDERGLVGCGVIEDNVAFFKLVLARDGRASGESLGGK